MVCSTQTVASSEVSLINICFVGRDFAPVCYIGCRTVAHLGRLSGILLLYLKISKMECGHSLCPSKSWVIIHLQTLLFCRYILSFHIRDFVLINLCLSKKKKQHSKTIPCCVFKKQTSQTKKCLSSAVGELKES